MGEPVRIAICGKGGVGKTSVAAVMVNCLKGEPGPRRILAIDADPACGLSLALGVEVKKTVDDIRREVVSDAKRGAARPEPLTVRRIEHDLFDALHEQDGFSLLSIGRPEDEGCFCKVNSLLKDLIAELAHAFDFVVIDGEAGVEQINRRVMKQVDYLVAVTDTSLKGIEVARTIAHLALDNAAVDCRELGLVVNRARSEEEASMVCARSGLEAWGWIPEEEAVRRLDLEGVPLHALGQDSPVVRSVRSVLSRMITR
ncbi:MAG TPA: AAA family ATPase [Deltaproteobacteria bacterium]|nr:AAA family ATPase [Deltaproteobacteria bacterium]HOM28382.1 AAA family ATPase [Deltaproteobacteria bacterium]HPP80281.1 AAA family ATPase [Deltaproteobacteria bacterium]